MLNCSFRSKLVTMRMQAIKGLQNVPPKTAWSCKMSQWWRNGLRLCQIAHQEMNVPVAACFMAWVNPAVVYIESRWSRWQEYLHVSSHATFPVQMAALGSDSKKQAKKFELFCIPVQKDQNILISEYVTFWVYSLHKMAFLPWWLWWQAAQKCNGKE